MTDEFCKAIMEGVDADLERISNELQSIRDHVIFWEEELEKHDYNTLDLKVTLEMAIYKLGGK